MRKCGLLWQERGLETLQHVSKRFKKATEDLSFMVFFRVVLSFDNARVYHADAFVEMSSKFHDRSLGNSLSFFRSYTLIIDIFRKPIQFDFSIDYSS